MQSVFARYKPLPLPPPPPPPVICSSKIMNIRMGYISLPWTELKWHEMKWVNYTKLFLSENVNEYSFNKTADAIQYVSFAAALNKLNEIWNAENESHFAKQSATEEKTTVWRRQFCWLVGSSANQHMPYTVAWRTGKFACMVNFII